MAVQQSAKKLLKKVLPEQNVQVFEVLFREVLPSPVGCESVGF